MYEYTTLQTLYADGAAVPEPLGRHENAILMGYCGDERVAAPTLNEVVLAADEAQPLFEEAMRNVVILLAIASSTATSLPTTFSTGRAPITLIDFPQVVVADGNPDAFAIFARDLERLCEYFRGQGLELRRSGAGARPLVAAHRPA